MSRAAEADEVPTGNRSRGHAVKVGAGILVTRVFGFLRDALVARYFGAGAHSDVWLAAIRTPNILQNLLGEQTLSAAFIPIYSRMVEEGREEEAGRFAGAIFGLLLVAAGGLALLGMLAARPVVAVFVHGFVDDAASGAAVDRYELAVQAVRIIFPMTGLLVLSAWALGILNSHRRFFLPYAAPALWNVAMISTLVAVGEPLLRSGQLVGPGLDHLLTALCWGALVGGLVQLLVQLPTVLGLLRGFRVRVSTRVAGVREALRSWGPVVASRGVVQLSSYFEQFLASFLAAGAVSAIGFAQRLYLLPIGLFAMSVVAVELPELSRLPADDRQGRISRIVGGLRQMAFLTVPTGVGYLLFGGLIVGAIYQRGVFGPQDTWLVFLVLGALTLGLLPSTSSRLLVNAFYSLSDTRTPARIAVVRVVTSVACGLVLMLWMDRWSLADLTGAPSDHDLGVVGLALGSPVGAGLEWILLHRRLRKRLPELRLPLGSGIRLLLLALAAGAVVAVGDRWIAPGGALWIRCGLTVSLFAALYLGGAWVLRYPELRTWIRRSTA